MRRIIAIIALLLVMTIPAGCGFLSREFDENNIICQMKIYDLWDDKTVYYELDNRGNTRECEEFKPNANKLYDNDEGVLLMSFEPNEPNENNFTIEYNENQHTISESLVEKLKDAGLKFAYREGCHDTWFTKVFEYDNEYYVEAMLNVNIACPFYLLKYDKKNKELVELWSGSEKEIKELRFTEGIQKWQKEL